MFLGLEHVAITSVDPQKLARWYRDTLGFAINFESAACSFVKLPDCSLIEIFASEGARPDSGMKTPGLRHLAITVDDFEGAAAHLRDKGVTLLTEPYFEDGKHLLFFRDAEGNILHLIRREVPLP